MRMGSLQDIVRGPEGTTITVGQFKLLGKSPGIHLTRHRITGDYPVVYRVITTPDGKRIGYILLVTFEDSTVDEKVAAALQEMTRRCPLGWVDFG